MGIEIPTTTVDCDGCGEELHLLNPYLKVTVKAQREVLIARDATQTDPNEIPDPDLYLGTKSGRGSLRRFHGFDCLRLYAEERTGRAVRIEPHHEDEIYVPEDNRSPEELVEAGELPREILALHAANAGEDDQ